MPLIRTRMLEVGDRVAYHGNGWAREIDGRMTWCNEGDIAEVIEFHEAQAKIPGWVIDHDEETGEPIYDEGIPAWVAVRFANGLTAAVDGRALKERRWTKAQS